MSIDHSKLPSIPRASLPDNYRRAKQMLAKCSRLDECKDWADKSKALASYAKQSLDRSLMNHAMRIHARATRRCGQLLEAIEKRPGQRTDTPHVGADMRLTRTQAGKEANLSIGQQTRAQRVARVPEESFEEQVEGDNPPTVTALAEQGTKKADQWPTKKEVVPWVASVALKSLVNEARRIDGDMPLEAFNGIGRISDTIAGELQWLAGYIKEIRKCIKKVT